MSFRKPLQIVSTYGNNPHENRMFNRRIAVEIFLSKKTWSHVNFISSTTMHHFIGTKLKIQVKKSRVNDKAKWDRVRLLNYFWHLLQESNGFFGHPP